MLDNDDARLAAARKTVLDAMGAEALVDASAVIGNFQRMVRIADGTGIPLDKPVALVSADLRDTLDLDSFGLASQTPKVGALGRVVGRAMGRAFPLITKVLRYRT